MKKGKFCELDVVSLERGYADKNADTQATIVSLASDSDFALLEFAHPTELDLLAVPLCLLKLETSKEQVN